MKIRSPILVALGHVDSGKTTLIDTIRGSSVAKSEPGLITQYISASYVPNSVIRERCGKMLDRLGIQITIPGLLWMDSPGHEAFTTLRKRGGAIADLAVLVVDIMEGFQPQTLESVQLLKQQRTPFLTALTKIDRLPGWTPKPGEPFLRSFEDQPSRAREAFEERFYRTVGQLGQEGFAAERFDRVEDFTRQVAIVPVSSLTGEGIADLLVVIAGIAQKFLSKGLEIRGGEGKGTVLEVKEVQGLGTTIDVIVYDGEARRGDHLVIGGKQVIRSRIKALLKPAPLKELRGGLFSPVEEVVAAAGVKIAGPGLEAVIPGSPLRAVRKEKNLEKAGRELQEEVEEVQFSSSREGALLRADTLGGLEALITLLRPRLPIRSAQVGGVSRADIVEARTMKSPLIFAFGVPVSPEVEKLARDNTVALFASKVIYQLVEAFEGWKSREKERQEEELLARAGRPARLRVLPGFLFRQKKPAVFGVEVEAGTLRPGAALGKEGKNLGEVKEIQDKGESRKQAVKGERVAISMPEVVFGKEVKEGDLLETLLSKKDRETLGKVSSRLRPDERELLEQA